MQVGGKRRLIVPPLSLTAKKGSAIDSPERHSHLRRRAARGARNSGDTLVTSHKDYYAVLDINPHADRRAIAEAYERLARRYQPDDNAPPTDPQRMREIDEAFDVLDDPERDARSTTACAPARSTAEEPARGRGRWMGARRGDDATASIGGVGHRCASAPAQRLARPRAPGVGRPRVHRGRHRPAARRARWDGERTVTLRERPPLCRDRRGHRRSTAARRRPYCALHRQPRRRHRVRLLSWPRTRSIRFGRRRGNPRLGPRLRDNG